MTTKDSICDSAIDVIGNTPLVALDRITAGRKGRILAKLDMLNPGFSKKDRAAKEIILEAERTGALKPGQTVIELTSGNMGTGLAIMCAVRGYPFIAVMSQGNSAERARMMQALGATVILVAQAPGSRVGEVSGADLALVEQKTVALTKTHNAFRADQFTLLGNANAHYKSAGNLNIFKRSRVFCFYNALNGYKVSVVKIIEIKTHFIFFWRVHHSGFFWNEVRNPFWGKTVFIFLHPF